MLLKIAESVVSQFFYYKNRVTNCCNVLVNFAYCDTKKQYPVNLRPYLTEDDPFPGSLDFKSKIELTVKLLEGVLEKRISFSDLL